ncbi:hypothetical protein B2J93_5199 [Marssonina coronariae]|uniref:Uncharacterized protein n=1 Tax=Diplocarpon coronariae TaxID=2795749 RepID=A0A218Z3L1_9HELO|nr:hypothetical protein B2J93_5199 [Marssonina coronariae]
MQQHTAGRTNNGQAPTMQVDTVVGKERIKCTGREVMRGINTGLDNIGECTLDSNAGKARYDEGRAPSSRRGGAANKTPNSFFNLLHPYHDHVLKLHNNRPAWHRGSESYLLALKDCLIPPQTSSEGFRGPPQYTEALRSK